jgi:hypothetical protein
MVLYGSAGLVSAQQLVLPPAVSEPAPQPAPRTYFHVSGDGRLEMQNAERALVLTNVTITMNSGTVTAERVVMNHTSMLLEVVGPMTVTFQNGATVTANGGFIRMPTAEHPAPTVQLRVDR